MIPLMLNPALVRLGLCGEGPLTLRRLKWLRDCGANPIVFAPDPSDELAIAAGVSLRRSIPDHKELTTLSALWIADFASDIANPLADLARATRVLVNVEDVMDYCDFQTPAIVRRGRLTLSISTGGASPAIASNIRQRLETAFPDAWTGLLEEVAASRSELRMQGATFPELLADAQARLHKSGL